VELIQAILFKTLGFGVVVRTKTGEGTKGHEIRGGKRKEEAFGCLRLDVPRG